MVDDFEALQAQLKAALAANEADRTIIHDVMHKLDKAINSRWWLTQGRGSHEWDDDRYRKEFETATANVLRAVKDLRRVCADLTNTPQTQEEVDAARAGIRLTVEAGAIEVAAPGRNFGFVMNSVWFDLPPGKYTVYIEPPR